MAYHRYKKTEAEQGAVPFSVRLERETSSEHYGFDVEADATGSVQVVVEVLADGPATGQLIEGDFITAIDGVSTDQASV